jgi:hypothetical protein
MISQQQKNCYHRILFQITLRKTNKSKYFGVELVENYVRYNCYNKNYLESL